MGGQTAKATQVASKRAALRRAIRTSTIDGLKILAGDLEEWEEVAGGMELEQLLRLVPGLEPLDRVNVLARLRVPPDARLFALTTERRRELADAARKEIQP